VTNLRSVLGSLVAVNANFVVVGGIAMQLHGSQYLTEDIDIVYERSRANGEKLIAALGQFQPRPRGFPDDLPFIFDVQTLMVTDILTLGTTAGDIDLLATLKGVGNFKAVEAASEPFSTDDLSFRVLSIDGLIAAKSAAGRPKDKAGVIELRALKEMTEG
jgi:hypothetical protein